METIKFNVENFPCLDFVLIKYGLQNGTLFVYSKFTNKLTDKKVDKTDDLE